MEKQAFNLNQHRTILKKDDISAIILNYDFNILSFNYWQQREYAFLPKQILDFYKLIIVEKGSFCCQFKNNQVIVHPHDCLLIPPYVTYSANCLDDEPVRFYFFDFQLQSKKDNQLPDFLNINQPICVSGIIQDAVLPIIKNALNSVKQREAGSYMLAKLSLERFFIEMYQRILPMHRANLVEPLTSNEEKTIVECMHYFANHLSSPIKVHELCNALHVSQSYLYKCISKTFNQSIQQAILDYKLKQSLIYLSQPYSIQEVALFCGFVSSYHFSRTFKEKYGLSPLKFKQSYFTE